MRTELQRSTGGAWYKHYDNLLLVIYRLIDLASTDVLHQFLIKLGSDLKAAVPLFLLWIDAQYDKAKKIKLQTLNTAKSGPL